MLGFLYLLWRRGRSPQLPPPADPADPADSPDPPAGLVSSPDASPPLDTGPAPVSTEPSGVTFPERARMIWRVAGRAPVAATAAAMPGTLLLGLAFPALLPNAATPPGVYMFLLAAIAVPGGIRLGWVGWRLRREDVWHGPPRLVLNRDAISVVAAGQTTRIQWAAVEWAGVMVEVPPRRSARTLVARLVPGASLPPPGHRLTWRFYEPHPRSFPRLRLVRICDLTLLAAEPAAVVAVVEQLAGGRWRGDVELAATSD